MNRKTKIFKDFSKMATDAFGTFSGLRKEIETIAKIKIDKMINRADLVKREEFETLKLIVKRLSTKNQKLERLIKNIKKKGIKKPR
tara:strand:- start:7438 stop:7695 length:258 start_codon:yes stop_codon:yes gene_type:complete